MEDFTGGFSETHDLKQAPKNLFKILFDAYNHDSQMGCSIDQAGRGTEAKLDNGLIVGHAYTITDVKRVRNTYLASFLFLFFIIHLEWLNAMYIYTTQKN